MKPERSVADELAKLERSVSSLVREVTAAREKFQGFKRGRKLQPFPTMPIYDQDAPVGNRSGWHSDSHTPEPRAALFENRDVINAMATADKATQIIYALGLDLDGAFRDLRALRSDIQAIKDDSDLRAEFKNWNEGR